jgi:hypothetical protein
MKRLLIILLLVSSCLIGFGQGTPGLTLRVPNNVTEFGINLPKGTMIIDCNTFNEYFTKVPLLSTKTIATCVIGTDLESKQETDPVFTAWNKSTGISITKSQVSDFPTTLSQFTNNITYIGANYDVLYASVLPASFSASLRVDHVNVALGFPHYGTVITAISENTDAGGAMQFYAPASPTSGGNSMKVRFGNYDASGHNSWTNWKTLWDDNNSNNTSTPWTASVLNSASDLNYTAGYSIYPRGSGINDWYLGRYSGIVIDNCLGQVANNAWRTGYYSDGGSFIPTINLYAGGNISLTGGMTIGGLSGTGTRMVVADNTGILSTQAIPSGGLGGTVVSVSVNSANGFAGTSSGGVNPALTLSTSVTGLLKGNGTAMSAATSGTDYEPALTFSTGLSRTGNTITNTITQYTDALARSAVSFTAGSGAYNSTTGVFTIPTNTNQLTNGAGFITGYSETDPTIYSWAKQGAGYISLAVGDNDSDGNPNYGLGLRTTNGYGSVVTLQGWAGIKLKTISGYATLDVSGNLYTSGSITANGGGFNSSRSLKNIHKDWVGTATDELSKFKLRDFNYKARPEVDSTLGFIIDEIPQSVAKYVLMNKGTAINTYTLHGLEIKAIQELTEENKELRKEVNELKEMFLKNTSKRVVYKYITKK